MLRSPMGPQLGGWQSILGRAVRERRQELELTLDEASRAIGISRSHLNLIELGKATGVSGEAVARIDAGLGSQGALVALLPPKDAADVTRSEEMRRAEFNKAVVALAASLFFDPERLTESQKVDAALLRDHESLTRDFVRRQHHARPQTILGPTRAHLNQLLSLESTSLSPGMRQQLDRIIAETAALAGWVAFRSNGDLVTAHAQLALGRQHAREAGDDILLAQLLAATSSSTRRWTFLVWRGSAFATRAEPAPGGAAQGRDRVPSGAWVDCGPPCHGTGVAWRYPQGSPTPGASGGDAAEPAVR